MSLLHKRLEILEAAISPPDGRPFVIWGTIGDATATMRRKTEDEIQIEIDAAIASGAMTVIDRPTVICWKTTTPASW
jgi:hypothetical protein